MFNLPKHCSKKVVAFMMVMSLVFVFKGTGFSGASSTNCGCRNSKNKDHTGSSKALTTTSLLDDAMLGLFGQGHSFSDVAKPFISSASKQYKKQKKQIYEIKESESEYEIQIEMPGTEASDISIEITGRQNVEDRVMQVEWKKAQSFYTRVFQLGRHIDLGKIDNGIISMYENGILSIYIPKVPIPSPVKIPVKHEVSKNAAEEYPTMQQEQTNNSTTNKNDILEIEVTSEMDKEDLVRIINEMMKLYNVSR